jgi:hypothetical protein
MTKFGAHWKHSILLVPPLLVAAVVVTGLGWLSIENLNGSVGARLAVHDKAGAVQNLLFRE